MEKEVGTITVKVRKMKKDAAYCGGGCNGCSCSHCKGAAIPPQQKVERKKK